MNIWDAVWLRLLPDTYARHHRRPAETLRGERFVMPPVVPVFLVGVVSAPLVKKMVKPIVRGTIKTSVKLAAGAKRAAHEANEELSDIAAEASAEILASEPQRGDNGRQPAKKAARQATAKAGS
ncbi:DUF5132 domain-containing protein [Streptomyces albus]|uniref:DUF5132 domain-containing protein n=2 Tax=Streptomyces TaxID=1883 RepID=UPI001F0A74D3|nr:DUF5132 domain-containing protein [Streptomyces albus]